MKETLTKIDEIGQISSNSIILENSDDFELLDSEITFSGKGNILYIEAGTKLHGSKINFFGDNSLIYLGSNRHVYYVNITAYNNSTCYIGRNNYFNGIINMILSEEKNIIVGNDGLFSLDIWMRTADPHLMYDVDAKRRINNSRSIYIGDHVWIGQHAMLLKGCKIGSGSIIGALSVLSKSVESNCAVAGNPGKVRRKGIFWLPQSVHSWTNEKTEKYKKVKANVAKEYTYLENYGVEYIDKIEDNLKQLHDANQRLALVMEMISSNNDKERFSRCSKKFKLIHCCKRIIRKIKNKIKKR